MREYIAPLILLVVLFVGFGLVHRNSRTGAGCSGCTTCSDKSECRNRNAETDVADTR